MDRRDVTIQTMTRRLAALALWTYFAWYLAAMVASLIGAPSEAGPAAAVLTAIVGAVGWMRGHMARRAPAELRLEPAG